jgi:hypothetical protein
VAEDPGAAYVTTDAQLAALDPAKTGPVLGLFANEHLPYEVERGDPGQGVPTLAEMATKAVDLLSKNPKGYFLLVEGGKIDMGSHLNNAKRTLTETVEFSKAIQAVLDKVNLDDTLVIVTADHSHGLVISGYAARNAPILGLAGNEGEPVVAGDGKPYSVLSFATGPGGVQKAPTCAPIRPRKTWTTSTTTSRPRQPGQRRPLGRGRGRVRRRPGRLSGPWRGRGVLHLPGHAACLRVRRRQMTSRRDEVS